jgi:hypothetical protein
MNTRRMAARLLVVVGLASSLVGPLQIALAEDAPPASGFANASSQQAVSQVRIHVVQARSQVKSQSDLRRAYRAAGCRYVGSHSRGSELCRELSQRLSGRLRGRLP